MDLTSVTFASILTLAVQGGISPPVEKKAVQEAEISTYILPNIAGLWQLELTDIDPNQPACRERYHFGKGGEFIGISGKEFTYGKYLYSHNSDSLPAIAIQTTYDNNVTDCSGNKIDQTGDIMATYVKLQGNQMQWCKDNQGKKCNMKFYRVLP